MTPELFLVIEAAGWNPLQPSEECARERAFPLFPNELAAEERVFVRTYILTADLLRRFLNAVRDAPDQPEPPMATIQKCALMHALCLAGHTLTPPTFAPIYEAYMDWHENRFEQSSAALEAALKRATLDGKVDIEQQEFEPAYTARLTILNLGWSDFAGDKRALAEAMRLVEARGTLPGHRVRTSAPEPTELDVHGILEMLTEQNSDRVLFDVTSDLKFRMKAEPVRDALETLAGKVEPVRQEGAVPLAELGPRADEDLDVTDVQALDPAKSAEIGDMLDAWRAFAEKRSCQPQDDAEAAVLAHWERLQSGELTLLALAEQSGIGRKRIERTFTSLVAAFESRLRE